MSKWIGDGSGETPTCDLFKHGLISDALYSHDMSHGFVDGATIFGSWALMCLGCHRRFGRGLGVGKGQQYDGKTFEKVAG